MSEYRVVARPDGWIVEILDRLPASADDRAATTRGWVKASDPFPTKEEAEQELKRLTNQ